MRAVATRAASAPRAPVTGARFRKTVKYALVRRFGGSLENVFFRFRLLSLRAKSWVGRPYTALYGMDRKLEKYLNFERGIFIEAGANDGIAQSNTYFLERKHGWNGLLIEPIPKYCALCRRSRKAKVVNYALGTFDQEGEYLDLLTGGLMSVPMSVDAKLLNGRSVHDHAAFGAREFGARAPQVVRTKVRALSTLLDELDIRHVDFFSLDVEGFELQVLKGLDLERHGPRFMLIETEQLAAVSNYLGARYALIEALSHHDYLFQRVSEIHA